MSFFRSCRYKTGPISKKKTKIGLAHILETCIFKGCKFCLSEKASRVLVMSIFLFSLFDCFSFSIFEMILSVFWLSLFN